MKMFSMKRRLCLWLFLVMACLLVGCTEKVTPEEQVHVVGYMESVFDEGGYYYSSDSVLHYMNAGGEDRELCTVEDQQIAYLWIRDEMLYVVCDGFSSEDFKDIFSIYRWNEDMKQLEHINTCDGAPLSLAVSERYIYYTVAEEMDNNQPAVGTSYSKMKNELWMCEIDGGEPQRMAVLEDTECFGGSLSLCASDDLQGIDLVYSYVEIQGEEETAYTCMYAWNYEKGELSRCADFTYEGINCAAARIVQNYLYYKALSQIDGYEWEFGRVNLTSGEGERLFSVKDGTVHLYGDYCVVWTRGIGSRVFLYAYQDEELLVSKQEIPESAHVLGMSKEYDWIELDSTDYTKLQGQQTKDMATYGIAGLEDYRKENCKEYAGENAELLMWHGASVKQDSQEMAQKEEEKMSIMQLTDGCIPEIVDHTIVYTGKNGEEQLLYTATEQEELIGIYVYDGDMYVHVRYLDEFEEEALTRYDAGEKKLSSVISLLPEEGQIADVAFCPGYILCLSRCAEEPLDVEGEMRNVWSYYASRMALEPDEDGAYMGNGAQLAYGGAVRYENQVQFEKKEYVEGETVCLTGAYRTNGEDCIERYEWDMRSNQVLAKKEEVLR